MLDTLNITTPAAELSQVRYREATYSLNTSVDRAKFTRQLYNLRHILESEENDDTEKKIQQLILMIDEHDTKHQLKKFNTKDSGTDTPGTPGTNNTLGKKRKRGQGASGSAQDATDCAELGEHGYEVEH
jgi:hypothetical protein